MGGPCSQRCLSLGWTPWLRSTVAGRRSFSFASRVYIIHNGIYRHIHLHQRPWIRDKSPLKNLLGHFGAIADLEWILYSRIHGASEKKYTDVSIASKQFRSMLILD